MAQLLGTSVASIKCNLRGTIKLQEEALPANEKVPTHTIPSLSQSVNLRLHRRDLSRPVPGGSAPSGIPPKASDMLIIMGVATVINAHNTHAPILAQIRAMQAAAAAHLQGRLTPKRRGVRYTLLWLQ